MVNAFLRKGMEECERYSAADQKLKNMQVSLDFTFFFFSLFVIFLHVYFFKSKVIFCSFKLLVKTVLSIIKNKTRLIYRDFITIP